MRKPARMVLQFFAIVAMVVTVTMMFAPSSQSNSPYRTALSKLAVSPAYAAGCPDKRCDRGLQCVSGAGYKCIRFNGKGCTATVCG